MVEEGILGEEYLKLDIPDWFLKLISEQKTLKDLTPREFNELISLSLFETFIYRSFNSNHIYQNKGGLFNTVYIHEGLISDLILIYQEILKKNDNNDNSDYRFNDEIIIESNDFKKYTSKIEYILLANNLNYIKDRVSRFYKSYLDEDKYSEALSVACASFTNKIRSFDLKKGFKILTFVSLYLDSDIKYFLNKDKILKYPKELVLLKKILDKMKDSDNCYSAYGYKELMFDLFGNIKESSIKQIQEIGELYFYILGYGSVTKNKFIDKYYSDFNSSSVFNNEKHIEIFKNNILGFIKENNKPEFLLSTIRDMSVNLDNIDSGCDSLDREIGDEDNSVSLGDTVKQDGFTNFEILIYQKSHWDLLDREIRLNGKKPNVPFTLLERIIAGTCINEYFTFKEFRDLLLEYGEFKGVGDKYAKNFHIYLSLFKFKDKTDWYQYDEWLLDALNFEQMGDILDFSEKYAKQVYDEKVKVKFDFFYKPRGIIFLRYDTTYHGKTKTFRDLGKVDNSTDDNKDEYVPPENFATSYQALRKIPNPTK